MEKPAQYQVVYGDASKMNILRTGEVDLVLTGPPYFSTETQTLLEQPVSKQNQLDRVRQEITSFAMSLRPVYLEIERVLKPTGVLVIQVKDIRYQRVFISLSEIHRQMIESTGLNLITRIYWHKKDKRSPALRFRDNPIVGAFRADEVEDIMVFARSDIPRTRNLPVELSKEEIEKCWRSPLWDLAPASRKRKHPFQFPDSLVRRIIALYTRKGDLVVDPFTGSGTTLKIAVKMGRRAVGYEIQDQYAKAADTVAESTLKLATKYDNK